MTLALTACGGSAEPDTTVETEDEETVFDPMTDQIEKAKAVEDSALQHKEDIDKAIVYTSVVNKAIKQKKKETKSPDTTTLILAFEEEQENQQQILIQQLKDLKDRYQDNPQAKEVLAAADALGKKVTPVEEEIVQTKSHASEDPLNFPIRVNNKLLLLMGTVDYAEGAPTQQSAAVFDQLSKQLDASLAKWKQLESSDVAAFNATVQKANLPAVTVGKGAE